MFIYIYFVPKENQNNYNTYFLMIGSDSVWDPNKKKSARPY